MPHMTRLPARFPAETKYVLEAHGNMVRRYVEFPNGERVELEPRKALSCRCLALRELDTARKKPAKAAAA
jgi:hypothetical protein